MSTRVVFLICTLGLLLSCGGGNQPAAQPSTTPAAGSTKPSPPPGPTFPFRDVTADSGVSFTHDNGAAGRRHFVETMAPGLALFDVEQDGDLDLYVINGAALPGSPAGTAVNRLFLNQGDGTFVDGTRASGLGDTGYGMGCAVGDYDGDGDLDVYVLNYGPNVLYQNDGQGRFIAVTAGVEDDSWSVAAAFLDVDGDGFQDLYVVNYLQYDVNTAEPCKAGDLEIYCSPELYDPAPDRLYRNVGGGSFRDISQQAGVATEGRGMGLAVGDFDADGDTDLYVTNDRSANLLYFNEGGKLAERAAEAGVGYGMTGRTEGGMGVVAGRFSNHQDAAGLFLTNFQKEPNRFYVYAGEGFFDDLTFPSGLGFPSKEMVSWGIGALDVEGDGDLDLAVGNGHVWDNAQAFIPGSSYHMPDQLFINDGSGKFEVSTFPGPAFSTRGMVCGDLDGDGDPDLVTTACGGPLQIWRNEVGTPDAFLMVDARDVGPNTHAYGALVTAKVGSHTIIREITNAGSYASHGDTRLYLGLGATGQANDLTFRWPDGEITRLEAVKGGRILTLHRKAPGQVEHGFQPFANGKEDTP